MGSILQTRRRGAAIFTTTFALLAGVVLATAISARADVTPTLTTTLTDTRPGAHSDLTVGMTFAYDDEALLQYAGHDDVPDDPDDDYETEDLKLVVVDTPAGLVGNPNAVPYAERCEFGDFYTASPIGHPDYYNVNECPASSQVGEIELKLRAHNLGNTILNIPGRINVLKTDPDVPATLGIYARPLDTLEAVTARLEIGPDADGDFHLRTLQLDPVPRVNLHQLGSGNETDVAIRVNEMNVTFFGTLANGNHFMTNPTRCDDWTSDLYATAYDRHTNANANPLGDSVGRFVKAVPHTIVPDCSDKAPVDVSGSATISTGERGASPDLEVTIAQPGLVGPPRGTDVPKKIVTTLPPSINVDHLQLGRLCSDADFNAGSCPRSTRVGVVDIETPLIAAGLRGYVHLLPGQSTALPDLGLDIGGAISFTQRGRNRYVGPLNNQIETTFDDIPQVGFGKLTLRIHGGQNGLLKTLDCPADSTTPEVGPVSFAFETYGGQSVTGATPVDVKPCRGVYPLKKVRCVKAGGSLTVNPVYQDRGNVARSALYVNKRKVQTVKKSPFRFNVKASKLRLKGKASRAHTLEVRATYKDGSVSKARRTFKRCR